MGRSCRRRTRPTTVLLQTKLAPRGLADSTAPPCVRQADEGLQGSCNAPRGGGGVTIKIIFARSRTEGGTYSSGPRAGSRAARRGEEDATSMSSCTAEGTMPGARYREALRTSPLPAAEVSARRSTSPDLYSVSLMRDASRASFISPAQSLKHFLAAVGTTLKCIEPRCLVYYASCTGRGRRVRLRLVKTTVTTMRCIYTISRLQDYKTGVNAQQDFSEAEFDNDGMRHVRMDE